MIYFLCSQLSIRNAIKTPKDIKGLFGNNNEHGYRFLTIWKDEAANAHAKLWRRNNLDHDKSYNSFLKLLESFDDVCYTEEYSKFIGQKVIKRINKNVIQ